MLLMMARETPSGARSSWSAPRSDSHPNPFRAPGAPDSRLTRSSSAELSKISHIISSRQPPSLSAGNCRTRTTLILVRNTLKNRNPRNSQKTKVARQSGSQQIPGIEVAFGFSSFTCLSAFDTPHRCFPLIATFANPSGTGTPLSCRISSLGRGI